MSEHHTALVLGGTGRTGGRALGQLLERGVEVRAIVRSAERLPAGVAAHAKLTVVEADVLRIRQEELLEQVRGCDAVVSCLGHNTNLKAFYTHAKVHNAPRGTNQFNLQWQVYFF